MQGMRLFDLDFWKDGERNRIYVRRTCNAKLAGEKQKSESEKGHETRYELDLRGGKRLGKLRRTSGIVEKGQREKKGQRKRTEKRTKEKGRKKRTEKKRPDELDRTNGIGWKTG